MHKNTKKSNKNQFQGKAIAKSSLNTSTEVRAEREIFPKA
jgi:hypothetical protein